MSTARINQAEREHLRFKERLLEIRRGFEPAFWVANITELFERVAYYGQAAVLAIFLHESLHLSTEQTGTLMGVFGFAVWFLPILGGSLADRFGFRKSLAFAYLILAVGYFLMGSLTAMWMAPLRQALPLFWVVLLVLMIPALGPSVVKPVVAGTTGRASSDSVRSIGYSIYYTLVNIVGTLRPIVAYLVRLSLGIDHVFRVCSSFSWLFLVVHASTGFVIAALFILALGEITQSPRYYEYVSRLAPPGQQGTYMGYAFLPIAIGYLIGGKLGGYLVHYFGDVLHRPEQMWWVVSAIGFATTLLMWIYNILFKPTAAADSSPAH